MTEFADADIARELRYRLHALAGRKNRSAQALDYNMFVKSWPTIAEHAQSMGPARGDMLAPVSRS